MNVMRIGSEDGKWMKLAQDRAQWLPLVLVVLNFRVLLPLRYLNMGTDTKIPIMRFFKTAMTVNT